MFEDILGKKDLTLAEKNQKEIERVWKKEKDAYRKKKQATSTIKK